MVGRSSEANARMVDVSIIIVSYNTKKLLLDCVSSIKKHTKVVAYEVIVVDNASTDGSVAALRDLRIKNHDLRIIENKKNLGFAAANNQGIKKATGRYILLLNSDTKLTEDAISKMVGWMDQHPRVGVATCTLTNAEGSLQATGGSFPTLFKVSLWATFLDDFPLVDDIFGSYHPHTPSFFTRSDFFEKEHGQDWVTGAFFLVRRKTQKEVGFLDEQFFMYVEEVDYCFRAKKKGWGIWYVPITKIIHLGGASTKGSILGEFVGLTKFYRKHKSNWQYPILLVLLRLAAFLRIIVFGILGRQKEAVRIYAKALATT